jgi:hypothetical protein
MPGGTKGRKSLFENGLGGNEPEDMERLGMGIRVSDDVQ